MSHIEWLEPDYVRDLVENRKFQIKDVISHLQITYPDVRGLSERNVKRFCTEHDIRSRGKISQEEVNLAVNQAVTEVGGTYGRKMMKGFLQYRFGLQVGKNRVSEALQAVQPEYHANCQQGVQNQLNPQSYHAPYFGYNLHMDQNEKLEMYGVIYVTALDSASFFTTNCMVMPEKNNITIYRDIFKSTIDGYELFEKVIFDSGCEFFLTLFMQEYLSQTPERRSRRAPFAQVPSTKNNRVERWWLELNKRVNYPIEHCLVDLEIRELADGTIQHHLFSIGYLIRQIVAYGSSLAFGAWNAHIIPGHGSPSSHIASNRAVVKLLWGQHYATVLTTG